VRQIGRALARALHVGLSRRCKIVDRLGQRLHLARIAGAQPFRRVMTQGRQFMPQALEGPKPELDLNPRSAREHRPQQQQEQRERLAEFVAGNPELVLVQSELHEDAFG
jgi:hypothetical protein